MKEFRSFLGNHLIQNDEWVTNTHFMIKKSALGRHENNFLNKAEHNPQADVLYNGVVKRFEDNEYKTKDKQFTARFVTDNNTVLEGNTKDDYTGLAQDYYNWFIKKGFEFYYIDTYSKLNPLGIYKDSQFVGILLPVRLDLNQDIKITPITEVA